MSDSTEKTNGVQFPNDHRPFPLHILPEGMQKVARGIAHALNGPEDMAAITMLGAVSSSIGKGLRFCAINKDQEVRSCLIILIGAPSTARKSEIGKQVFRPVFDRNIPNPLGKEQPLILTCGNATTEGIKMLFSKGDAPNCCISSVSWEARNAIRTSLIAAHRKGAGGSSQFNSDECFWTGLYSGDTDDNVRKGVKGEGEYSYFKEPWGSITWYTQPEVLDELVQNVVMASSGFLQRVLVSRVFPVVDPNPTPRDSYRKTEEYDRLWTRPLNTLLDCYRLNLLDEDGIENIRYIPVPGETEAVFLDYNREVNRLVLTKYMGMEAAINRSLDNVLRLALNLHAYKNLSESHTKPMLPETAQEAITLARWFLQNWTDEYVVPMRNAELARLDRIEEVLRFQGYISCREAQRASGAATAEHARALMNKLTDLKRVEPMVKPEEKGVREAWCRSSQWSPTYRHAKGKETNGAAN